MLSRRGKADWKSGVEVSGEDFGLQDARGTECAMRSLLMPAAGRTQADPAAAAQQRVAPAPASREAVPRSPPLTGSSISFSGNSVHLGMDV